VSDLTLASPENENEDVIETLSDVRDSTFKMNYLIYQKYAWDNDPIAYVIINNYESLIKCAYATPNFL
jgi:hypothetical protein